MVAEAPRPRATPKRAFIVSPPGLPKSYARVRSEIVRRFILDPAAEERGYEVLGSDEFEGSWTIDRGLVEHLVRDDIVVVDLTDSHPLIFYALAVRHAALKSVIYLAEMGHEPLIDIPPNEIIFYDEKDMETMKDAREKFDEAMSKVEEGGAGLYSPFFGIMGGRAASEETNADQRDEVLKMFRILGASLEEIKMALGRIQSPSIEGEEQIHSRGVGLPQIELGDGKVDEVLRRLLRKASRMKSLSERFDSRGIRP